MLTLQYSVFNPEPFVCLVKPTRLLHEGGLPSIIKTLVEKHCKELQNSVTRSAELYKNLGASGEGEWTSDEDEVAAFDVKEAIEKKIIASMDPSQLSTSEPLNVYLIAPRKLFQGQCIILLQLLTNRSNLGTQIPTSAITPSCVRSPRATIITSGT